MLINTIITNILREQTYILSDDTNECVIIDPGFQTHQEKESIDSFLANQKLKLVAIWFTHLHLDHMMGAKYLTEKYNIPTFACEKDLILRKANKAMALAWGIDFDDDGFEITNYIADGDIMHFGNSTLKAIHVPGHSPGSIAFYSADDAFCISGDVLFNCSIGRSDLAGGDAQLLINSIKSKLFTLPDETTILPGHGYATTIADEKKYNPYLKNSEL